MAHKLQIGAQILKRKFPNISIRDTENDFYRIISNEKYETEKHPNNTRKEIFALQIANQFYFQLFLPKISQSDGNKSFKHDMKMMNTSRQPPSLREICAASELLEREIHLIMFPGSDEGFECFSGAKFVPILKSFNAKKKRHLILLMTMVDEDTACFVKVEVCKKIEGANQQCDDEDDEDTNPLMQYISNRRHALCLDKRFRNSFSVLSDISLKSSVDHEGILGLLTSMIYGDTEHTSLVEQIIIEFETEEERMDTFAPFLQADEEAYEKARKSWTWNHRKNLLTELAKSRLANRAVDKGLLFAMASIFNCEIYLKDNEWEIYAPLSGFYDTPFESKVLIEKTWDYYKVRVTESCSCLCLVPFPNVQGPLSELENNVLELVQKELERRTCCEGRRHGRHAHLSHIKDYSTKETEKVPYTVTFSKNLQLAMGRLDIERRRIDALSDGIGGSAEECLSKEIFGDETSVDKVRDNIGMQKKRKLAEYMRLAANWTKLTIFVFLTARMKWIPFLPETRKDNCRYYITLMYINEEGSFLRVVPKAGCNCHLFPPDVDPKPTSAIENLATSRNWKRDFHKPMVTFLSEQPSDDMFKDENIQSPALTPYSEFRTVLQRTDMQGRTIDETRDFTHSLYRCISKEMFGTEDHYQRVLDEMVKEIKNNSSLYGQFVRQFDAPGHQSKDSTKKVTSQYDQLFISFKRREGTVRDKFKRQATIEWEEACFFADRIKDGLDLGDLELFAAATFFQTPIYVLSVGTLKDGRRCTYWKSFTPMRGKKKPENFSNLQQTNKCQRNKYHISLYRSFTGRFYRICSETGCNCQLEPPEGPCEKSEDLPSAESTFLLKAREVEDAFILVRIALHLWIRNAMALEILCQTVLAEFETRRRNVNVATITGASVGTVGSILVTVGLIAAPVTAGISLGLTVAGGVIGGIGGLTTTGSKVSEVLLSRGSQGELDVYQNNLTERTSILETSLKNLKEKLENLATFEQQAHFKATAIDLKAITSLLRAMKDAFMVPFLIAKSATKGVATVSSVILPLAYIVDVFVMADGIKGLIQGSKTNASMKLRNLAFSLRSQRINLQNWAYGNCHRD